MSPSTLSWAAVFPKVSVIGSVATTTMKTAAPVTSMSKYPNAPAR